MDIVRCRVNPDPSTISPLSLNGFAMVPHDLLANFDRYGLIRSDIQRLGVLIGLMKGGPVFSMAQRQMASILNESLDSLQRFLARCARKGLVTWRQTVLEDGTKDICVYDCSGLAAIIEAARAPMIAAKVRHGAHGALTSKGTHPSPQKCGDSGKTPKTCIGDNNNSVRAARAADSPTREEVVVSAKQSDPDPVSAKTPPSAPPGEVEPAEIGLLIEKGVARKVAWNLYRDRGGEIIRKQLRCLPHRQAHDPAAVLVDSIRDDWSRPAGLRQADAATRQEEQVRRERQQQAERDRKRQEEQAMRNRRFESLSEGERRDLRARALEELKHNPGFRIFKDVGREQMIEAHMRKLHDEANGLCAIGGVA